PNVLMPTIFETKAESKYLSVAVAAIIARYYFLNAIDKINEHYDIQLPLGAGDKPQAYLNYLKQKNPSLLPLITKMNFKNLQK
ncbi:MAG: ribonuclease HIII, partial [Erysipelotrichaceae bacterium]